MRKGAVERLYSDIREVIGADAKARFAHLKNRGAAAAQNAHGLAGDQAHLQKAGGGAAGSTYVGDDSCCAFCTFVKPHERHVVDPFHVVTLQDVLLFISFRC